MTEATPQTINGFAAYAPELDQTEEGFSADFYDNYVTLEAGHFWFRNRAALITWALRKYQPRLQSFFEVGCGTGYVLERIAQTFPKATLCGSEMFTRALGLVAARVPQAELIQMDARKIPFENRFDAIGAFDVLEHIKEDEIVLQQMYKSLKSGGLLLVTVPQHAWLWSTVDDYSQHVRRYDAQDLKQKVEAAGFDVIRSTSFITSLLPAMMLSRFLNRNKPAQEFDAQAEIRISPLVNAVFSLILRLEIALIKCGINFPVGGSRLIIARKK